MVGQRGGFVRVSARLAAGGAGQLLGAPISGEAQGAARGGVSAERVPGRAAGQESERWHDRIVRTDRVRNPAVVIAKPASLAHDRVWERRLDSAHAAAPDGR